jgi:hypothetical protein
VQVSFVVRVRSPSQNFREASARLSQDQDQAQAQAQDQDQDRTAQGASFEHICACLGRVQPDKIMSEIGTEGFMKTWRVYMSFFIIWHGVCYLWFCLVIVGACLCFVLSFVLVLSLVLSCLSIVFVLELSFVLVLSCLGVVLVLSWCCLVMALSWCFDLSCLGVVLSWSSCLGVVLVL